jgi:superfamily II DNA or RNA helicase
MSGSLAKKLMTAGRYAFQARAVRDIMAALRGSKNVCFLATCGIGKSHVIGLAAEAMVRRGGRVLVIAGHQNDLKHQLTDRLVEYGHFRKDQVEVVGSGGVAAKKISKKTKVLVTIPNAVSREGAVAKIGRVDYIIIDEAHINADVENDEGMIPSILDQYPRARVLLMTATGYSLIRGARFNYKARDVRVIADYDHPFAVREKLVHPIEMHIQKFDFDIPANAREADGELSTAGRTALKKAFRSEGIIKRVLAEILKSDTGEKNLIVVPPGEGLYTDVVDHLNGSRKGSTVYRHSSAGDEHNAEADARFRGDPAVRFCVVVYKNSVGWDFPELDNVIDLTLTQNTDLITQRAFRACRVSKLKPKKRPKYIYFTPSGESEETAIHVLTWAHWRMCKDGLLADHTLVPDDEVAYAAMTKELKESGRLEISHEKIRSIEIATMSAVKRSLKKGDSHHAHTHETAGSWRHAPIVGGENRAIAVLSNWYLSVVLPKWEGKISAHLTPLYKKNRAAYDSAKAAIVNGVRAILTRQPSMTPAIEKKLDDAILRIISSVARQDTSDKTAAGGGRTS